MGTIRLAIALLALGYIVFAYHTVIADIVGRGTSTPIPMGEPSYNLRPVAMNGCTVIGLNTNETTGGCPAAQGQGVIPSN